MTNQRPWSINRSFAVKHDQLLSVDAPGLFAFSGDGDSDVLTVVAGAAPAHGTVSIDANGSFAYIPTAGYVGTDSFGYRVSDGVSLSDVSFVSIQVFNSVPLAAADYYTISHDRTLTIGVLNGVLANDRDLNYDPLTVTVVAGHNTQHGTLTLNTNGSFSYIPAAGYVGTDTFRYRVSDGAQTADADVTINVVNQRPVATNDKYGATVEQTLNIPAVAGILANDADADLDVLLAVLYSGPSHGSLILNANGSFSYTPAAGFIGVDEFRYEAKDPLNLKSFITTVSISTALVATDDHLTISHDRTLTGNVGDNDFSVSGNPPSFVLLSSPASGSFTLNSSGAYSFVPASHFVGQVTFTYLFHANGHDSNISTGTIDVVNEAPLVFTGTWRASHGQTITADVASGLAFRSRDRNNDALTFSVVSQPTHGTLTLNSNGSFVYVPTDSSFTGADSFTWKAFDGIAYSEVKTAYIELLNHKASLSDDSYTIHAGHTLTVTAANGLLSNDYDSDSDTLIPTITVQPTHGTITLAANGSFVYVPESAAINATDTFKYRVYDGAEFSAEQTVTITVTNSIPAASAPKYQTHHSATLTVNSQSGLLSNATDADGDSITAQLVTGTAHGTLQLSSEGSFVYVPVAGWTGTDSFTFTLSDGLQVSSPITAEVGVRNEVAHVNDDWFAIHRNQFLVIAAADMLHNDADPDHDLVNVSISGNPTHGTLTQTAPGAWTYTPNANFVGTDTFQYTVSDGASTSAAATVEVEVKNSAPQGGDDRFSIPHDRTFTTPTAEILENDYDADGDPLTVTLVSTVSHGTLILNANGTLSYTPATAFVGTDSFEYRISDGVAQSDVILATFDVRNTAPSAYRQYHRIQRQGAHCYASSGLLNGSVDAEDDVLTPSVLTNPSHGLWLLMPVERGHILRAAVLWARTVLHSASATVFNSVIRRL
ncbi:MAG: Ig-like domain-containing protein [Planctomycetaceae bacterium]